MDVLKEVANQRGSRETVSEQPPIADSQSRSVGIRSVEEMARVLFVRLVQSGVPFQFILSEHAADILNKCHVASDGKSAFERLKRRQQLGKLWRLAQQLCSGLLASFLEES